MFTTRTRTRTATAARPRILAIAALAAGSSALVGAVVVGAASSDETRSADDIPAAEAASPIDDENGKSRPESPVESPADEPVELPVVSPAESPMEPPADQSDQADPPDQPADPEQPAPGPAGVIDGDEAGVDPTPPPPPPPPPGPSELASVPKSPPPPPPPSSIPGPVDLVTPPMDPGPAPIDDLAAPVDPTPFDGPSDFQVVPLPGHLGTITSGFSGCQLDCITSALLSANHANADMQLDIVATVPAHFEIEVNEVGGSWGEHFNNPGYDETWNATLGPLEPDTTYDLTLIAIDADGYSKVYDHRFTTADIVDGFASNHMGCALECLTSGTVKVDGDPNDVEVHVTSNAPAALQVWFSTSAPTWVDDPAAKPLPESRVYSNDNPSTSWTFDVKDLDYDTEYHVVARAEDAHGEHYRVGTFRTGEDPSVGVLVTFEEINVTYDGDRGSLNRGEIRMGWGFDGGHLGHRSEEKMHARTISLDAHHQQWFEIHPEHGEVPNPSVAVGERDADGLTEFCSVGIGSGLEPAYVADCDLKVNVAHLGGPITLADIESFPTCAEIGVNAGIGTRCAALGSAVFGTRDSDYAHFSVIVSFWVAD